ncbi:hypothetical protein BT96DRAFT_932932 [Gymnopus androsaceus JB14]|uniref:Uncharacterized protein n=1 Tax=Gymnopus androsaceus JB14 TaxID=1447944 RepID=A0A6A4I799_9AGAR|nr:hypothetical protein BT96DRAFT_932932 [Gymnopus androsaceus JB14]
MTSYKLGLSLHFCHVTASFLFSVMLLSSTIIKGSNDFSRHLEDTGVQKWPGYNSNISNSSTLFIITQYPFEVISAFNVYGNQSSQNVAGFLARPGFISPKKSPDFRARLSKTERK